MLRIFKCSLNQRGLFANGTKCVLPGRAVLALSSLSNISLEALLGFFLNLSDFFVWKLVRLFDSILISKFLLSFLNSKMLNLFAALFICAMLGAVQSLSTWYDMKTQRCLSSLSLNIETAYFLRAFHRAYCTNETSVVCKFASEARAEFRTEKEVVSGPNWLQRSPVYLNVYNAFKTHPFFSFLRCIKSGFGFYFDSKVLYHTSISYEDDEYYYGVNGVLRVPDGESSFGSTRKQFVVGLLNFTREEMNSKIEMLAKINDFTPEKYYPFTFNCNSFTDKLTKVFFDNPIPLYLQQSVMENSFWHGLDDLIYEYQSKMRFTLIWLLNLLAEFCMIAFDSIALYTFDSITFLYDPQNLQ